MEFVKIDTDGTCGPIWMELVPIFLSWSWHLICIKKVVNKVILKSDLIIAKKNVMPIMYCLTAINIADCVELP